jgi:hypothetical protein
MKRTKHDKCRSQVVAFANIKKGLYATDNWSGSMMYVNEGCDAIHIVGRAPFDREGNTYSLDGTICQRLEAVLTHETIHKIVNKLEGYEASECLDAIEGDHYTFWDTILRADFMWVVSEDLLNAP